MPAGSGRDGTFVDFEHSLNAAVRRLRMTLGDEAEVPRFIETVHKRGYRFLALDEPPCAHDASQPAGARRRSRTSCGSARGWRCFRSARTTGSRDGLTEEAITQLTQTCPRTIGVIARTSVERAQRDGGGAAEIGRALDADYLVEGNVRREGDRLRITAQLIESQEETHLWAKTFDRVMTDALSLQTEVAGEIAKAVTDALAVGSETA